MEAQSDYPQFYLLMALNTVYSHGGLWPGPHQMSPVSLPWLFGLPFGVVHPAPVGSVLPAHPDCPAARNTNIETFSLHHKS